MVVGDVAVYYEIQITQKKLSWHSISFSAVCILFLLDSKFFFLEIC